MEIFEPINVWVFFKGIKIEPHIFFWKNRRIKIDSINLVHMTRNGDSVLHHFSVSSQGNFYRLLFDTTRLKWFLEQVEEDEV